jgi:uncharacterized protein
MMQKLTIALFLGMCIPALQAMIKEPSYLDLLPRELGQVIIKYLSSAKNAEEAVDSIKTFLSVDPRLTGLLTDSKFIDRFLNDLPSQIQSGDPHWARIEAALALGNTVALKWLKEYLDAYPDAYETLDRYIVSLTRTKKADELRLLSQAGIDLSPALLEEVKVGNSGAVQILIGVGANVNFQTKEQETPLIIAINKGYRDVVRILIDAKANVNYEKIGGETPLMYAISKNNKEIVDELIRAKANVNTTDHRNITPLMLAASKGNKDIVKALLDAGADVHAQDAKNRTALNIAQTKAHSEIADLLTKYGAK